MVDHVVVGEGDVEGVEFWDECLGTVLDAGGFGRVVVAAVVELPLGVP